MYCTTSIEQTLSCSLNALYGQKKQYFVINSRNKDNLKGLGNADLQTKKKTGERQRAPPNLKQQIEGDAPHEQMNSVRLVILIPKPVLLING